VKLLGALEKPFYAAVDPLVARLIRAGVRPNTITTIGTGLVLVSALAFGLGHIRIGGLLLLLSGVTDTLDGQVARGGAMVTKFGAFYDSTLDRVADGAILGGLAIFFARNDVLRGVPPWAGTPMLAVTLLGVIATFLTSYTRARAEALGIEMKGIGFLERPERIVLLSAPQAFFGLALGGYALMFIVSLLSASAWVTAVQRIVHVYRVTQPLDASRPAADPSAASAGASSARHGGEGAAHGRRPNAPHPALKGDLSS
jgi:CDP-diacylglycerol---glycerol-3-phosphate 3-phosphatidyltransferase